MDRVTSESDYSDDSQAQPQGGLGQDLSERSAAILSLPAEVVIMILGRVPVRNLLKLRFVSKAFKAVVDGYEPAIVRPTVLLNQARVRAEARHHSDSIEYPFEQAIQRCYDYYGPGFGKTNRLGSGLDTGLRLNFCDVWVETAFPDLVCAQAALDTAIDLDYLLEEMFERVGSTTDLHRRLQRITQRLMQNGCDQLAIAELSDAVQRLDLVDIFAGPLTEHDDGLRNASRVVRELAIHDCRFVVAYGGNLRWANFGAMKSWLGLSDIKLESNLAIKIRKSARGCMLDEKRVKMDHFKRAVMLEEIFIW